jgi:hypothetical protein
MYGYGNSLYLTANKILASANAGNPPVNTVAPAITGTAQEGQIVTCSTGTWTGTPTYTYQWKRNGSNIGSATNSTYTLVTADVGQSIKCTVTATNTLGSSNADSNTVTPTSSVDPDAQAFITAASITNPTQQSAINTLVTNLKGYNVWTKIKALYPFCGGTSSTHKWNLKDPRDLDAAFRLVFNGGWTHSSTGALPNGTNAYANTFLTPSTNLNLTSHSYGIYSRTNNTSGTQVYGSTDLTNFLTNNLSTGNFVSGTSVMNLITYTANPSTSLLMASRTSNTVFRAFRAGVFLNQNTNNITALPDRIFYLGARNGAGAAEYFNNHQLAFAFLADGLTDTEAANFYTAVQAFNTTLSRQV